MEVTCVLFERRKRKGEKDSTIPSWTVTEVLPSKTQQGVKIGMKNGRAVHESYFSALAWILTL